MSAKKILLIEDSADDIELTVLAMKKSNILNEMVIARDGLEALDYLHARGDYKDRNPEELPALILLDLQLPKLSGIEVLKQLRAEEKFKLIPVVVLTSSNEEKDRLNGYNFGANSYIQKPVDFMQFVSAVQQVGLYWMVLNVNPPD